MKEKKETIHDIKNIHHVRLARLFHYLNDNDVEISVTEKNVKSPVKVIYTSKGKDGNPTITGLFAKAIGISEEKFGQYTLRHAHTRGVYSDSAQIPPRINVIASIVPYLNYNSSGEYSNGITEKGFFGIRDWVEPYLTEPNSIILEPKREQVHETKYISDQLSSMKGYLFGSLFFNTLMKPKFRTLAEINTPFSRLIARLEHKIGYCLDTSTKEGAYILETLQTLTEEGGALSAYHDNEEFLIPGYRDLHLPTHPDQALYYFAQRMSAENYKQQVITQEEMLRLYLNRYGLIYSFIGKPELLDKSNDFFNSLLVYTHLEWDSIRLFIEAFAEKVLNEIEFVVYSAPNLKEAMNRQQHRVSVDVLSSILSKYHFKNGLESTFKARFGNILVERLEKLPVTTVSIDYQSPESIKKVVRGIIKDVLIGRIKEDLHYNMDLKSF